MNRFFPFIRTFFIAFVAVLCLFLAFACDRSSVSRASVVSVDAEVDFILRMREKRYSIGDPAFGFPKIGEIGDLHSWGIFEQAPCRIVFPDVFVGSNARVDFAIGVLNGAWDKPGDGVRFQLSVVIPGQPPQIVYNRYIDPKKNANERKWFPESAAIPEIANGTAQVLFETFPGETSSDNDAQADWAFWANPRLISAGRQETHTAHRKPNILLITLDTLRADFVGCYGNDWIQTPTLDRIAREGVLFENAHTVNYHTNPSHLSMLTSLSSYAHGIIGNQQRLTAPLPCLPQIMKELGYTTLASVSAIHLDNFMEGLSRWFDGYDKVIPHEVRPASVISSLAIERLQQVHNQPFFYWIHYYDCHQPYRAVGKYHRMYYKGDPTDPLRNTIENASFPADWDIESSTNWMRPYTDLEYFRREYAAEVTYMDDQLNRVFEALGQLKLEEDTIAILVSDHGEGFGEHGIYFDHWSQFENDIHVPLLIRYPGQVPAGKRIPRIVSTLDIAPTILDLIGEKDNYLARKLFEGASLRGLWEDENHRTDARTIGFTNGPYYINSAAYDERYKLIWEMQRRVYNRDSETLTDRVWIYDRKKDPQEQNPAACFYWSDNPERKDSWKKESSSKPPVLKSKDFQNVRDKAKRKKVPSPSELRGWFLERNGRDFIQEEYLQDEEFFTRAIALLEKVRDSINPPTVLERVRDLPDILQQIGGADPSAKPVTDPAMLDFLRSLGYTGNASD